MENVNLFQFITQGGVAIWLLLQWHQQSKTNAAYQSKFIILDQTLAGIDKGMGEIKHSIKETNNKLDMFLKNEIDILKDMVEKFEK